MEHGTWGNFEDGWNKYDYTSNNFKVHQIYILSPEVKKSVDKVIGETKSFGRNNHLYNCPFCDGAEKDGVVLLGYKYPKFRVTCTSCDCMIEDDRIDKVQSAWNMRGGMSWSEQERKANQKII